MDESGPQTGMVRARSASIRPSRPPSSTDYNLRILWPLARWIEEKGGGTATLATVVEGTDATPADFDGKTRWVSASTFETIIEQARATMPDDATFKRACVHRIQEAYGPIRYVLWAASPSAVFSQSVKTFRLVSRVGKPSIVAQGRTHVRVRIEPTGKPASRLTCLMRQAQSQALPTLWGLPAASLHEDSCMGRGDATCEEHYRWYAPRSVLPTLLGAVVFALLGLALRYAGFQSFSPTVSLVGLVVLGGAFGYIVEGRRTERANESTRTEVTDALRQLAVDESESRREALELSQRQKHWTRLVEEEMTSRSAAIQRLTSGVEELHQARATKVLGFSHDLRNPLQVIHTNAQYLETAGPVQADANAAGAVQDIVTSVNRMRRMLGDLVLVTKSQREFVTMAPQRVETGELTESLRRRLRALAYGSDVRTTAFATREAPDHVEIDPLALDRIVDNLLTNAVKYTDRGSIVLELDGTPEHLVIKVSDTGRGIEPDAVDRIFHAGGSAPESRRGDSFGVGLSVVVQLLQQIGGRLEVMSKPGSGTTFWVYLPVTAISRESGEKLGTQRESTDDALRRVVRIRNVPA